MPSSSSSFYRLELCSFFLVPLLFFFSFILSFFLLSFLHNTSVPFNITISFSLSSKSIYSPGHSTRTLSVITFSLSFRFDSFPSRLRLIQRLWPLRSADTVEEFECYNPLFSRSIVHEIRSKSQLCSKCLLRINRSIICARSLAHV
jgi:hypothetical protein